MSEPLPHLKRSKEEFPNTKSFQPVTGSRKVASQFYLKGVAWADSKLILSGSCGCVTTELQIVGPPVSVHINCTYLFLERGSFCFA